MANFISSYEIGLMDLNTLLQQIVALTAAIDLDAWGQAIDPIMLDLEQLNTLCLERKFLSDEERDALRHGIDNINALIASFDK